VNPTERRRIVHRRHVIALAPVILASSCASSDLPHAAPAASSALSVPPVPKVERRGVAPKPRVSVKPKPRVVAPPRLGPAVVITIPKVWADLVQCEAHGDWRYGAPGHPGDPGYREYEGGPNFVHSTWLRYGGGKFAAHAYDASPLQQLVIAKRTLRAEGVHAWPVCGPRAGLTMKDAA
jgi:hypothetical protein